MGRTLACSRNRLFSTAVGHTRKTVPERVDETIAPRIDIDEPIALVRGLETFVDFQKSDTILSEAGFTGLEDLQDNRTVLIEN